MRHEIAQLWTQALRSGEFTQGKGHLDDKGKLCPLGVLSQLAMLLGVCDYTEVKGRGAYDDELGRLSISVKEWAGMYGQNGEIKGEFVTIAGLNDLFDYDFIDTAVYIEENYERL